MTKLPTGWKRSKMGEIGQYLNGKAFKSQDWKSSGRPIIRIQNLTGSGTEFNYFNGEIEDRYVVQPGDLLFSWSATLGTYIWKGPEAVLNQHIFKVESNIDKRFHRYLLDFKIQEMHSQTHGSGMVHITKKSFDAIEVNIPPIEEQHKIVELLEDHLSRLDAALADVKQAKIMAAQFRQSLLNSVFYGGNFKSVNLGTCIELIMGQAPPGITCNKNGEGTPFVKVGEFAKLYPTIEEWTLKPLRLAKKGDVLICVVGATVGKINLGIDCAIGRSVAAIRPKNALLQKYLYYFLELKMLEIRGQSKGSAQGVITKDYINSIEIPLPELKVQQDVLDLLESNFSQVEKSIEGSNIIERESVSLRRSLLQAAFTGQLAKEVASV
jgi:type I restriction enzyme S subunit